jgi:prophage regulatory protein
MPDPIQKFISPRQTAEKFGISHATLWRWVKFQPDFPRPISFSRGCTRFSEAELDAYIKSRQVLR